MGRRKKSAGTQILSDQDSQKRKVRQEIKLSKNLSEMDKKELRESAIAMQNRLNAEYFASERYQEELKREAKERTPLIRALRWHGDD